MTERFFEPKIAIFSFRIRFWIPKIISKTDFFARCGNKFVFRQFFTLLVQ